ncbi:plasmid replication initiator TrfA [Pseudomonas turukhanskensis]|uniref:TrfA protein n=1 Tax=Pseudomonas turukhanskensis TaxID=1806536 RepID=A0A9W6K5U5_9PSED|nr:hypothetical protein GCM10017655_30780 [Pseudomonas turukhanskensis]
MPNPKARMEELNQKRATRPTTIAITQQAEVTLKLPTWPGGVRGVPNAVLRSALFGVSRDQIRPYLDHVAIPSLKGYAIEYSGPRLDQCDLDVWETVLHLAQSEAHGRKVEVDVSEILQLLGLTDTGPNRKNLKSRLNRLGSTSLSIQAERFRYEGSLIDEVHCDLLPQKYEVRLNSELPRLFACDLYTRVQWNVRKELQGKPLAQWLHGFYATHAKPLPLKVETIQRLCGSETAELSKFTQLLRRALNRLVTASEVHDQQFSYELKGERLFVMRKPSASQHRHLKRKKDTVPAGSRTVTTR